MAMLIFWSLLSWGIAILSGKFIRVGAEKKA